MMSAVLEILSSGSVGLIFKLEGFSYTYEQITPSPLHPPTHPSHTFCPNRLRLKVLLYFPGPKVCAWYSI